MSDRLDRIEQIVETLAESTARNAGDIAELRGIVENFALQLDVFVAEGRLFRSELRGLRTESRRILERLERHTSDGHGA